MDTPLRPRRVRGLTLVELMATLAIAAVLLGVAVPSLAKLVHSVHLSTASNALMASLRLARSEALKRGARVAVCKSADGVTCAAVGGWEQGWILFQDRNGNGALDEDDTLIQREEAVGGKLRVTGNLPVARAIAFGANGGARSPGGGLQAGTVTLCRLSAAPGPARRVVITTGGRVRVVSATVDSCE